MVRSLTKRGMPKPFAILIAALLALYFVPFVAAPANADTVGGFEIEGNLVDDQGAGIDWSSVDTSSSAFATDVDNVNSSGQDTTTFKGASKEYNLQNESGGWPGWQFGSGNATGKSDFGRWATYTNTDASNHVWFFLGFDRGFGTGTAKYAFELNQIIQNPTTQANPTRSQGDIRLVVWDQGNGVITLTGDSQNTDVGLYTWDDPDQGDGGVAEDTDQDGVWVKSNTSGEFEGASNIGDTPVSVPSWWTSGNLDANGELPKDTFLEFGIDLTSFGAVLGCPSHGFSAANARSITGTGGPGTLVDYLQALPVHIPSTCTSLVTNATNQVVIGNSITDTATLTPSNATGTVTFNVYGPGDTNCTDTPVATLGAVTVSGGTATSPAYTPTEIGTYRWIASYTSDDTAHFADTAGACNDPNEQSVVVKKQPNISTDAEDDAQLLSNDPSLTDTATVSNLTSDATGSVTFKVYGPDDSNCSGAVAFTDTQTLGTVSSGSAQATSAEFTPTAAGTYRWIASYSGDGKNEPVSGSCNDANEQSEVLPTSPSITTDADDTAKLPSDNSVSDTATLSGVTANAGGTITFKLFGPDTGTPTCDDTVSGNLVFTSSAIAVNGPGSYGPVSTTVDQAGTYYWIAYYSGDANNSAVSGVCGETNETSDVGKATPQISTTATNASLPGSISDTAHLTGLTADATGTVTFNVWGPFDTNSSPTCSGTPFATVAVALGSVGSDHSIDVPSGNVTVTAAGKYYWVASYDGDSNNEAVTGSCGDDGETSTVGKASPAISTQAEATDAVLPGTSVKDTATVTGLTPDATGSVTFALYSDNTCDTLVTTLGPVSIGTVTGGTASATSGSYTGLDSAGTYWFIATYSGDANNSAVSGKCGDDNESVTINKAGPAISTVAVATDERLPGTSVKDTATLTGLSDNAGGTVTFTLYSDVTCDTVVTTLGPVGISAASNGTATAESSAYTGLNLAGTYYFIASYSGDANNEAVSGNCGDPNESVEILKAKPDITTEVPDRVITLGRDGSDLTDTATLSGGTVNPPISGEINFKLYGPFDSAPDANSCTDATLFDGGVGDHNPQEVDVDGNGDYTTPDAVRVTQAGFYTWVASYDGDDNNHAATHACGQAEETVEVQPRQPVMTTLASATELAIGDSGSASFSDQAMLSEATNDATGTITFELFGPFTSAPTSDSCASGGAVQGSPVAVNGNGTYQGPTVSVSQTGYYTWVATYSGDANNTSATHPCGQPSETVHVTKANPTLVKIANPPSGSTVQPGDAITYSVTVGNTGDAAIDDGVVKDTLPGYVTVDQASVTASGGTFTAGGVPTTSAGTIVWTVDLAPGATKTLTYKVTVDFAAPDLTTLVNVAEFFNLRASTTHRTPSGNMTIVKEVSPVAGGGVVVNFGDTLTYTLTATATGDENQPNAVVTDYLPGSDPARPKSGETTYVPGSAACIGAGTCTVTGPDANGKITWSLGNMAAGTSRQVTFKVTIDDVAGDPGETIAVDILNAGTVKSDRTPLTPSNEVITPVTKVLPVKIAKPKQLPHTGATLPIGPAVGTGIVLLVLGLLLTSIGRRRMGIRRR